MSFQNSTVISLCLVFASAVVVNDASTAQTRSTIPCKVKDCSTRYKDTRISPVRSDVIEAIKRIKSRQGTVEDRILVGNFFIEVEKLNLAQEEFFLGSQLAKQNGDLEGEANIHTKQAELFTITGNFEEASSHLTSAKTIYETLGNQQGINSTNQQLRNLRIQERRIRQFRQISP